jgi:prepilin-type N-terminal cleavage/methylation domain-containing protein
MSKKSILKSSKFTKGFTLIELLVVIAIIGILSAVVVVSINSARDKSKATFIKSSLKSLYSQAEIFYTQNGTYAGLFDATTYDCIGDLSDIAESMTLQGITVKCYSRNDPSRSDVYLRFGATAIIYDANDFKAWSTDQNGVVTWDQQGVNASGDYVSPDVSTGMTFVVSSTVCADAGGRLPSLEQLFTLGSAYGSASLVATGTAIYKPTSPGFTTNAYWSSVLVPTDSSLAYRVGFSGGGITTSPTTNGAYVRCVR